MSSPSVFQANLGVFQSDLPKIEEALQRVPFSERSKVGRFVVLNMEGDPKFPYHGAIKTMHYSIAIGLGTGEIGIHVAAVQCLFNGWPERGIYSALSGAKRVVEPLLIEWKDGFEYIITELFNQGSLSSFLLTMGHRIPLFLKDWIGYSAAMAMLECHQRGVVLRDFKPTNMLIRQQPNGEYDLRITDLGGAFLMKEGTRQEAVRVIGTLGFRAPEIWEAYVMNSQSSPASYKGDAWSLGCFLYDLAVCRAFRAKLLGGPGKKATGEESRLLYAAHLGTFAAQIDNLLTREPKWRPSVAQTCMKMNLAFMQRHSNFLSKQLMEEEWRQVRLGAPLPEAEWVFKEFLEKADHSILKLISEYALDL